MNRGFVGTIQLKNEKMPASFCWWRTNRETEGNVLMGRYIQQNDDYAWR